MFRWQAHAGLTHIEPGSFVLASSPYSTLATAATLDVLNGQRMRAAEIISLDRGKGLPFKRRRSMGALMLARPLTLRCQHSS
jgi:hypothetical protein